MILILSETEQPTLISKHGQLHSLSEDELSHQPARLKAKMETETEMGMGIL